MAAGGLHARELQREWVVTEVVPLCAEPLMGQFLRSATWERKGFAAKSPALLNAWWEP